MIKQPTPVEIANDAIDQLQVARDYMSWLDSLAWAICASHEKRHDHHTKQLAEVTHYLAGDYHNILDGEVKSLIEHLEKINLRN